MDGPELPTGITLACDLLLQATSMALHFMQIHHSVFYSTCMKEIEKAQTRQQDK